MNTRAVLLAGASGLVGGLVRQQLLAQPQGPRVIAPLRRSLAAPTPRWIELVDTLEAPAGDDPLRAPLAAAAPVLDAYVCCLGTTLRTAGSRERFLAVDRDLVLRLAELARGQGARHAILVSSVGASPQSGNFYLRVKGETERALGELGFDRVDMLRPGLLLGDRAESRPAESVMQAVAPVTNLLMPGALSRYRAIRAETVAAAAVALLAERTPGRFVHEHAALQSLAGNR
ncbi:hypothetical protein [Arenimonas sp. MALMAid1274]|uniref:hypothetical protein n=1 Tax=Arenimonas sp. MALMAid1274 TaxID=3411630 RepID=UPI003BA2AB87